MLAENIKVSNLIHQKFLIRPTSDRLKNLFFLIIQSKNILIALKVNFFDLFTGTGSIGLEAFSRGAETVYLIDKNLNLSNFQKKILLN